MAHKINTAIAGRQWNHTKHIQISRRPASGQTQDGYQLFDGELNKRLQTRSKKLPLSFPQIVDEGEHDQTRKRVTKATRVMRIICFIVYSFGSF